MTEPERKCFCGWPVPARAGVFALKDKVREETQAPGYFAAVVCPVCGFQHRFFQQPEDHLINEAANPDEGPCLNGDEIRRQRLIH